MPGPNCCAPLVTIATSLNDDSASLSWTRIRALPPASSPNRDLKLVRLPADLHPGDAEAIGGLGEIDQGGRLLRLWRPLRQPQTLCDAVDPAPEAALDAAAHHHYRHEYVRRIAARHLHLHDRI